MQRWLRRSNPFQGLAAVAYLGSAVANSEDRRTIPGKERREEDTPRQKSQLSVLFSSFLSSSARFNWAMRSVGSFCDMLRCFASLVCDSLRIFFCCIYFRRPVRVCGGILTTFASSVHVHTYYRRDERAATENMPVLFGHLDMLQIDRRVGNVTPGVDLPLVTLRDRT